ncbi:MAG: UTP--glucose-1-phosphate uridylyltransferase GalU [Bacillota bacterium]
MRVDKAVIPVAGLGTRFLPVTKAQPKEMLPIVDTPIIQYVVEEAVASGITDILFVTGRGKRAIEDHFDRSVELEYFLKQTGKQKMAKALRDISNLADVHFIRQKEPLGLGHAVLLARHHVGNEPFAVLLGDEIFCGQTPCLAQMVAVFKSSGHPVVAAQRVTRQEVSNYGVIDARPLSDLLFEVQDLVEKPPLHDAPSDLAVAGRYVLTPDIFPLLAATRPGSGGEIQLTDALRQLTRKRSVYALIPNAERYDVGHLLGFIKANILFAVRRKDIGPEVIKFLRDLLEGDSRESGATRGQTV